MRADIPFVLSPSTNGGRRPARLLLRSLISIAFVFQVSCVADGGASTALPTGVTSLGRIGLVTARDEPVYGSESSAAIKAEGAAAGALYGALSCLDILRGGDPAGAAFVLVCLPIAALAGAVGLANEAAYADTISAARARAQDRLAAMHLNEVAENTALEHARVVGLQLLPLDREAGPAGPGDAAAYAGFSDKVDSVIEVEILRVEAAASAAKDVPMTFIIRAQTRLIDVRDGRLLDSHDDVYSTPRRTADEWLADGGRALNEALQAGVRDIVVRTLDAILDETMIYRPSGPTRVGYLDGLVPGYALRTVDPPFRARLKLPGSLFESKNYCASSEGNYGSLERYHLASLQPTFRWEPLPVDFDLTLGEGPGQAHDLRYDLQVFDVSGKAYERMGLTEPSHMVEVPLTQCSEFRWTVRARFTLDGAPRATEWTGGYNTIGGYVDPGWIRGHSGKPGLAATPGSPLPFYPIVLTPSADGKACTCQSPVATNPDH